MSKTPEQVQRDQRDADLSRRSFLKGAGGAAAGAAFAQGAQAAQEAAVAEPETGVQVLSGATEIELSINGEARRLTVEPRTTLLSALRSRLEPAMTGTKEVCDSGNCGACTVLVEGKPVYSCMQLAVTVQGKPVTTVEGFGKPDQMSAVQEAFCNNDALMCGFCTPGFVVATEAVLAKHPDPDAETIRHELAGNICRCGTYDGVFKAVQEASATRRGGAK